VDLTKQQLAAVLATCKINLFTPLKTISLQQLAVSDLEHEAVAVSSLQFPATSSL